MIYESTIDNMLFLIRRLGVVKKKHIISFFSDTQENIEYYIEENIAERVIDYDEKRDLLLWHNNRHRLDPIIEDGITKCFGTIVGFGSNNIKEMLLDINYPVKLIVLTNKNALLDVTVINDYSEAKMAFIQRKLIAVEDDMGDEIHHVAIVNNKEFGEKMCEYNFDSYCIFNKKGEPIIHNL